MYDLMLGGSHHGAADRHAAAALQAAAPHVAAGLRANRAFAMRASRFCAARGIDQFLDLGSGIPTMGNVHQVVRSAIPSARVAYVDIDAVAVAHARELLARDPSNTGVTVTHADLREVEHVLTAPTVTEVLDFARPIGLLAVGVLHFIPDRDRPADILARYRSAMRAGGMLVISHASLDHDQPEVAAAMREGTRVYAGRVESAYPRDRDEISALFSGTTLFPPGLTDVADWPTQPFGGRESASGAYGGVAEVPPHAKG
jgi:hypothetical protein